jgi:thiol-disulfide isomerase/thioredoxin
MIVDNYCLGLFLLVLFLLYIDNKNNLEGYAELSELANGEGDGTAGLGKQVDSHAEIVQEEPKQKYVPIGLKPQKIQMDAPSSMSESLGMLSGAPVNMENYMLLPMDTNTGIRTMDSKLPMPYPRVGGKGNLGKGLELGSEQGSEQGSEPVQRKGGPQKGANNIKAIIVYAPWCGWSKKSLPDFEKMKEKLNSTLPHETNGWNVSLELHNSETVVGKAVAKELNVKGFPSVIIDENGTKTEGPRKYEEMISHINSKTGGNIQA